jgi:hypothetical protein
MKLQFAAAVLAGVTIAGAAQAQTIQGASTGLSSPAATITFEGLGNNTSITAQYAALGVIFGSDWYSSISGYFYGTGGGVTSASNFQPCCTSPLDIFFTQAVQGAAFQYGSNLGLSTFTAFLNGNVVSHFTTITSTSGFDTPQYWGFDNSVKLDAIRIDAFTGNDAFTIDNLQVGVTATPEPATLALLGTGFAGVFGVVQRRRRRKATV